MLRQADAAHEFERILEDWAVAEVEPRPEFSRSSAGRTSASGSTTGPSAVTPEELTVSPTNVRTQFELALALAAAGRGPLAVSAAARASEMAKTK